MATISIDYDSKGDVQLVLGKESPDPLDQASEPSAQSLEQKSPALYDMGPVGLQVAAFRFRVSSVKLVSSSIYFKTMLEGSRFREGRELGERGSVELELSDPEDDPNAMMIVLGILHDNNSRIPKKVDLPTLEKITILVDRFQWHALVAPHALLWVDELVELVQSPGLSDVVGGDLLALLYIVWLFGFKDHFKSVSRLAQLDACASLDVADENIRLPNRVLEAINKRRDTAFKNIERVLLAFRDYILSGEEQKEQDGNFENQKLGYMVYGSAVFFAQACELLEFAKTDHAGNSISSVRGQVKSMPSFAGRQSVSTYTILPEGTWDLKYKLENAIEGMKLDEWGLDYDDFKTLPRERPVVSLD